MSSEIALSSNMFGDRCCVSRREEKREERGGGGGERRGGEGREGRRARPLDTPTAGDSTNHSIDVQMLLDPLTPYVRTHVHDFLTTVHCAVKFTMKTETGYKTTPTQGAHLPGRRHTPQADSSFAPECRGTLRPVPLCV